MPRPLSLLLLLALLTACTSNETATPAAPPATPTVSRIALTGTVTGPAGYSATRDLIGKLRGYVEAPQPGMRVTVTDLALQARPDAPSTTTDAQGRFTLMVPETAGIVVAWPASMSAPLVAVYRGAGEVALSTATTLTTRKLALELARPGAPPFAAVDLAQLASVTGLVAKSLAGGALSPDYSLPSWTMALDSYAYQLQGELARALNLLLPGSVPPRGLR